MVVKDNFEQVEMKDVRDILQDSGVVVDLVALSAGGAVTGRHHLERCDMFSADRTIDEVGVDEYDGAVLPGGTDNSDELRVGLVAIEFIEEMYDKVVAAICHATWSLMSAGILSGRQVTPFPSLEDDVINAEAEWVDQEVVIDGSIVISRSPDEIPAFTYCHEWPCGAYQKSSAT